MRPIFSVVIPTFEPERFLIEAVNSVLAQDPGPEQMQIAIVDDASPTVRPSSLISRLAAPGRIEVYEHENNLGLAGNWNRAISHARGGLVHLLHQDDAVRPGFYAHLWRGFKSAPQVGMAFCRHSYIDEAGNVSRISHRERWRAGVLSSWLQRIGESQRVQCPAAILRREVYDALGGFREDLKFALDWEMWVRVASRYEVWYEPSILAYYRRHGGNETARLQSSGVLGPDVLKAIEVFSQHFPSQQRSLLQQRAYRRLARSQLRRGAKLLKHDLKEGARAQVGIARDALARLPDTLATRASWRKLARLERQIGEPAAH